MSDDEDRTAGDRRPSVGRPFEKGRSGNPRGRPRKTSSLGEEVRVALTEKVEAREKGKTRQISKRSATAKQLANASASGNLQAIKLTADLIDRAQAAKKDEPEHVLGPDDQEIVDRLILRIRQGWNRTEEEIADED